LRYRAMLLTNQKPPTLLKAGGLGSSEWSDFASPA